LASRTDDAQLTLDVKLAPAVGIGQETPITVALANNGRGTSLPLTVNATIPDDTEFVRATPTLTRRTGGTVTWSLDGLRGGSNQNLVLVVRPTKNGLATFGISAETTDGNRATKRVNTQVDTAGLKLKMEGETFASLGEVAPLQLLVTNSGNVPIENATAFLELPDGISISKPRTKPSEIPLGQIAIGDTRTIPLPLTGSRPGKFPIKVTVTGDGGLAERAETNLTIGRAELELAISSTESIPLGQSSLVELRVTNRGDSTVRNTELQVNLPRGVLPDSATEGGKTSREGANWSIGTLPPGETKVVRVNLTGDRILDRGLIIANAEAELANGGRLKAKKATVDLSVVGLPILTLELADPSGPVPVGSRANYRVTIRNRGNAIARDVEVSSECSAELRALRGSGPDRATATVTDKQWTFPKFDLPAGATVTFTLDSEGKTAGTARVIAQVKCREVNTNVREEQATRVIAR
jgi:Domain of unknown function DUF11